VIIAAIDVVVTIPAIDQVVAVIAVDDIRLGEVIDIPIEIIIESCSVNLRHRCLLSFMFRADLIMRSEGISPSCATGWLIPCDGIIGHDG
jgi:hypothetical protein